MIDNPLAGDTVLVTGGAGFIGSHLVHRLLPSADVRVLDDFSTGRRERIPDGVEIYEGDVRNASLLERVLDGVDVVFHAAALARVEETIERPVESTERNCLGTVRLLEEALKAEARVVFSSSAAIYGPPDSLPIAESDRKTPRSPYGVDKRAADRYVRLYDELYDLDTVSLRYFNVYGPLPEGGVGGGVVSDFVERAIRGDDLHIEGDGSQTRDFVHVDDVVKANLLAASSPVSGRAYNVAAGESITIERLARTIVDLVPTDVGLVYDDPRPGDIDASRADIDRIEAEIGFEPSLSLDDGLASLVRDAMEWGVRDHSVSDTSPDLGGR